MQLIDTHTHLDFPDFDADRDTLLQHSRAAGVQRMLVLGVHPPGALVTLFHQGASALAGAS